MIRGLVRKNLALMRLVRGYKLYQHQPDWLGILRTDKKMWDNARFSAGGPKILIPTSVGAYLPGTSLESLLAIALTLRGAKVEFLLCDRALLACFECMDGITLSEQQLVKKGARAFICASCFGSADKAYRRLGLPLNYYSHNITQEERERAADIARQIAVSEIPGYSYEGIAIGEHSLAGALRFYAKGELGQTVNEEIVLRKFFESGLLTCFALRRLLAAKGKFDAAIFHHGIYTPMGIIGEVCRAKDVRVINWNPAYRKQCFVFNHDQTYHHGLMTEPVSAWESMPWDTNRRSRMLEYLKSRWLGSNDWIWFHEKPQFDLAPVEREFGIDFSRPVIGMLTNVIWDAQLHYPKNIFTNMIEWLKETIQYFSARKDLQLLIRVHPAEIRGTIPSRQKAVDQINKMFPRLASNIKVIPPENQVSTYPLMEHCDSVIIYGTKTGIELAGTGIPVIVAGEAWIKNKGITIDPASKEEYFSILADLPIGKRMAPETVERAIRYAYHFFFRRAIPVKNLKSSPSGLRGVPYEINLKSLSELLPGVDAGLDLICDGILNNAPFVFQPESADS